MIRFSLRCAEGHGFDSWFASAAAFDALAAAGRLECAVCGGTQVDKAPMAPAVATGGAASGDRAGAPDRPGGRHGGPAPNRPFSGPPEHPVEVALAALRRHVEENSDYVGLDFAAEARAIHEGRSPERAIHGEARPDEARRLLEDGVPVAPLPFTPARRLN